LDLSNQFGVMAPTHDEHDELSSGEESSGNSSRPPGTNVEYKRRRERNNEAVKKSRQKSKQKTKAMMDRVDKLRNENDDLEENIKILQKELGILKDLFMAHAGEAHGVRLNETELAGLLRDDREINEGVNLLMNLSQGSPPRGYQPRTNQEDPYITTEP